jgi:hypothetical protein
MNSRLVYELYGSTWRLSTVQTLAALLERLWIRFSLYKVDVITGANCKVIENLEEMLRSLHEGMKVCTAIPFPALNVLKVVVFVSKRKSEY